MALDGDGVAAPDSKSTPHYLMYSGSWRGDRVIANSDVGLVVLDVSRGIRIESVLATPRFEHGITEPTFTDDARIIGWANLAGRGRPFGTQGEPMWDLALVELQPRRGELHRRRGVARAVLDALGPQPEQMTTARGDRRR